MNKGTLWMVATPIGNLSDISVRAQEVLSAVDGILAEDTRHSGKLLMHLGISKPMRACDQHKELSMVEWLDRALSKGESWAFISDAGSPAISDPGGRLVDGIQARGHAVHVVPGASAVTAALMGAGLKAQPYIFLGFLPRKKGPLVSALKQYAQTASTLVFFESAQRISETLKRCEADLLGRRIVVARELTKTFETFHRGYVGEPLHPPLVEKGEMVVVIEGAALVESTGGTRPLVNILKNPAWTKKDKIAALKDEHGLSRNEAYDLLEWAHEKGLLKSNTPEKSSRS